MFQGPEVVDALTRAGVTHVVWLPDSELGQWDVALRSAPGIELIRVCREGEALALAGGLLLGGKRPVVLLQCTGLFEAGDALRNIVHDLKLPLVLVVGVRSWLALQKSQSTDTCPLYTEAIVRAWGIEHGWWNPGAPYELTDACRWAWTEGRARVLLLPE